MVHYLGAKHKMADEFPLFVLSLPGDEARRAPLCDWLRKHGITYELFYGVDGRQRLGPEWATNIDRDAAKLALGRAMGDGEFACALSHQEIYRNVLDRGLPGAVVLEDDAVPTEAFVGFLARGDYRRADMILLDHSNTRVAGKAVDLGTGIFGHPVVLSPFLTTAYTVDAAAAMGLRRASLPISFTADWPCDISKFGAVAAMPRPVGHPSDAAVSHISADRRNQQHRGGRFFDAGYWQRWWRKRRSVRLPDA